MGKDEPRIELIPPSDDLPPDEVWSWGVLRWRKMSRSELEKIFPSRPQPDDGKPLDGVVTLTYVDGSSRRYPVVKGKAID